MELILCRYNTVKGATLGDLYYNNNFECVTLEDEIREIANTPVKDWKIPGKTAIPAGKYNLTITWSNRFGRKLPLLENVPGFTGVRIHPGNTAENTDGCILTGMKKELNRVSNSAFAFNRLYDKLETILEYESVSIIIQNPVNHGMAA